MPTISDLTLKHRHDGTVDVSSWLTQGFAALVWFSQGAQPHVMWHVTPECRQGITDSLILSALAAAT